MITSYIHDSISLCDEEGRLHVKPPYNSVLAYPVPRGIINKSIIEATKEIKKLTKQIQSSIFKQQNWERKNKKNHIFLNKVGMEF